MRRSTRAKTKPENDQRCFGLRIEGQHLQLAIAHRLPNNRYRLEIDSIANDRSSGWLTPSSADQLQDAIKTLVERHEIRHELVAVSLDGDFCVTRVAMGSTERVDKEQSLLEVRVPRYLQLGPGEKVTGNARKSITPAVDYAVTGVVNRSLIQVIYESLRANDLNVTWVEPSLVSVARLLGRARFGGDRPVLIADGTGSQWDVGIACAGRLLLDYRPASATTVESLRDAVEGHLSRLKRFCQRHRGIASGELSQLFICGEPTKAAEAEAVLRSSQHIEAKALTVPALDSLYEIDDHLRNASSVPAVATVLPLLTGVVAADVPDLLDEVRREPDLPFVSRVLRTGWPVIAATCLLAVSYGLVSGQRYRLGGTDQSRSEIEAQIRANQIRFSKLARQRDRLNHLKTIESQSTEPNWVRMLTQITQSLPDTAKLNSYEVTSNAAVSLSGTVTDESLVFQLVNDFRHLPGVDQVALRGTTPDETIRGTRFSIGLETAKRANAALNGSPTDSDVTGEEREQDE